MWSLLWFVTVQSDRKLHLIKLIHSFLGPPIIIKNWCVFNLSALELLGAVVHAKIIGGFFSHHAYPFELARKSLNSDKRRGWSRHSYRIHTWSPILIAISQTVNLDKTANQPSKENFFRDERWMQKWVHWRIFQFHVNQAEPIRYRALEVDKLKAPQTTRTVEKGLNIQTWN